MKITLKPAIINIELSYKEVAKNIGVSKKH